MGIISARSVTPPYCTVLVRGKKLSENRDHHKIYCKRSVRTDISAPIQIFNPCFRILLAWDEYKTEASTEEKDNNINKKNTAFAGWLAGWLAGSHIVDALRSWSDRGGSTVQYSAVQVRIP